MSINFTASPSCVANIRRYAVLQTRHPIEKFPLRLKVDGMVEESCRVQTAATGEITVRLVGFSPLDGPFFPFFPRRRVCLCAVELSS